MILVLGCISLLQFRIPGWMQCLLRSVQGRAQNKGLLCIPWYLSLLSKDPNTLTHHCHFWWPSCHHLFTPYVHFRISSHRSGLNNCILDHLWSTDYFHLYGWDHWFPCFRWKVVYLFCSLGSRLRLQTSSDFPLSLFSLLHRSGTQIRTLHNQLASLLKFKQGLQVGRDDSLVGRGHTKQARGPKFRSPAPT